MDFIIIIITARGYKVFLKFSFVRYWTVHGTSTQRCLTVQIKARHLTEFWANSFHLPVLQPVSVRPILWYLPTFSVFKLAFFRDVYPTKFCTHSLCPTKSNLPVFSLLPFRMGKSRLMILPSYLCSLVTFEPIGRFLWNSMEMPCHWRWPRCYSLSPLVSTILKMADDRSSEVDAKLAPVSLGLWMVTFGNHGNQTIIVRQLKRYFCDNGSHTWTHCLSTVSVEGM
jgi:hypothetical protein